MATNSTDTVSPVTVYTKAGCPGCKITIQKLEEMGFPVTLKHLEDDANLAEVKARGFAQAPVVITDTDSWSGLRPDKLTTLAAK